jgi:hypothetical protein
VKAATAAAATEATEAVVKAATAAAVMAATAAAVKEVKEAAATEVKEAAATVAEAKGLHIRCPPARFRMWSTRCRGCPFSRDSQTAPRCSPHP